MQISSGYFARDCRGDQDERKWKSRYGSYLGSTMNLVVFILTNGSWVGGATISVHKVIWLRNTLQELDPL